MVRKSPAWLRPAIEYGPLAVFLATYLTTKDIFLATGAIMATTTVALIVSYVTERRVPVMLVVTAVLVVFFGGLTLLLQDERFIKIKPTIVYCLFAVVLLGGLLFGKPLLRVMLGAAWQLPDRAWYVLTGRFAIFFGAMAALNEYVWRTQSTDFWVHFKVWGAIGLTLAFTASQAPYLMRHQVVESEENLERPDGD